MYEMDKQTRTWHQDNVRAHTARASVPFLKQPTPDFTEPEDWASKRQDLNMNYCIWSLLLAELQNCRCDIHSIDDSKTSLGRAWNNISQVILQNAT